MLRLTNRDAASEGHKCSWTAWDFSALLPLKQGQVSKLIFENDVIRNRISNDFDKRYISQPKAQ